MFLQCGESSSEPGALHPVREFGYCGPTIVAAVTGASMQQIHDVITGYRVGQPGRTSRTMWTKSGMVKGTWADELAEALRAFGFTLDTPEVPRVRSSFAQWTKSRTSEQRKQTFLVLVATRKSAHWVLVRGQMFLDTLTGGAPVHITKATVRRQMVYSICRIVRLGTPTQTLDMQDESEAYQPRLSDRCLCGCEQIAKRNFLPGHDSRLKAQLRRVMRAEAILSLVVPAETRRILAAQGLVGYRIVNGALQEV